MHGRHSAAAANTWSVTLQPIAVTFAPSNRSYDAFPLSLCCRSCLHSTSLSFISPPYTAWALTPILHPPAPPAAAAAAAPYPTFAPPSPSLLTAIASHSPAAQAMLPPRTLSRRVLHVLQLTPPAAATSFCPRVFTSLCIRPHHASKRMTRRRTVNVITIR